MLFQLAFVGICITAWLKQTNGHRHWWFWLSQGAMWQLIRRAMYFYMLFLCGDKSNCCPRIQAFTFLFVPTMVSISYFIGGIGALRYMVDRQKAVAASRYEIEQLHERLNDGR